MSDDVFLTPEELAERWKVSIGHLASLRFRGQGPPYFKLGKEKGSGAIRYQLSAVEEYEQTRLSPAGLS